MSDEVLIYARNLAIALHEKHYPHVTQWRPEESVLGLLLQIDNMTSTLIQPPLGEPESKQGIDCGDLHHSPTSNLRLVCPGCGRDTDGEGIWVRGN